MVVVVSLKKNLGYSLLELVVVLVVISILVFIAYPSYQQYVIKTKRVQMMAELHNIASYIRAQKSIEGTYRNLTSPSIFSSRILEESVLTFNAKPQVETTYPYNGEALYTLTISPLSKGSNHIESSKWLLKAEPIAQGQMSLDGILSLDHKGLKCRQHICSYNDEWRK